MVTESDAWHEVVAAWPPRRDLETLMHLPREEAARILRQPLPDLTTLADTIEPMDMEALCRAVAANARPDAVIAYNVLCLLASRSSPLLTRPALSAWCQAIATAQAPVIQRWHDEESDAAVSALYNEFLARVPIGVPFEDLLLVMGPPTDEKPLGDDGCWAMYVGEEHGFQIWGDRNGRYTADTFA